MIIDNETGEYKVHEWITKYTQSGELSIVTGYFTIGALAYLSKINQEKINKYRFILGDIVNFEADRSRALDLLNENIGIEASLKLSQIAREAVAFLELDKVAAKTLEPNFCHAKVYVHNSNIDQKDSYFISGSSNLTEAGIGLKKSSNVELNIAETGKNNQYKELAPWFEGLWKRQQAHDYKTIVDENGKTQKIPFKEYLINEIKKIFIEYTPLQLYYKVLFELFGNELYLDGNNTEFNRELGRLENTVIYKSLYEFQQKGVLSLIKMLQRYNGAILADAVGLGKTWSALAVIKFFEMKGYTSVLLCPKKLEHNWSKFLEPGNKFEKDRFEYKLRFHTDLFEERWDKYSRGDSLTLEQMCDSKPKILVIDESHNLRNSKSNRYKYLVENILSKAEGDIKVLMLSATPINNSLLDIRNQFKLMVRGQAEGFEETLDIKNVDYTFRAAQKAFNEWTQETEPKIGDFIKNLPPNFFRLTDSLTVARTRKMIEGQQNNLEFPKKAKPENVFVTPKLIGNFESFEELFEHFPPKLSGYQPSFYIDEYDKKDILHNEKQRDHFLVKMMYILLVKRLESSWFSFQSTVDKVLAHHQNALEKVRAYERLSNNETIENDDTDEILLEDEDFAAQMEQITLGKKRQTRLADIDANDNLSFFKEDLKIDIEALQLLQTNIADLQRKIEKELTTSKKDKSSDIKLETLIAKIKAKQASGENRGNKKVIIFTVYKDTAFYLFDQLTARGFENVAAISGDATKIWNETGETKKYEPVLERFAPFTKLFMEKEWSFNPTESDASVLDHFEEWCNWTEENHNATFEKLQNPIDILIATDVLSEGQNLQDCDMVINYDIHWNPVRVIQRMGRVDRLGSPNDKIFGINFWPSNNINSYLNLQGRIEKRMAAMKLAGSEVHLEFTDTFKEMAEDEALEQSQKDKMLRQMETTFDDIDGERSLGFDDFSLENFRQELVNALKGKEEFYANMPNGVYTGFAQTIDDLPNEGVVALMGYPRKPAQSINYKYKSYELVYVDLEGNPLLLNLKEVLGFLDHHKEADRVVATAIDQGKEAEINKLANALVRWVEKQGVEEETQEDGTIKKKAGADTLSMLDKIKTGSKQAIDKLKSGDVGSKKFNKDNFDLITWFVVQ